MEGSSSFWVLALVVFSIVLCLLNAALLLEAAGVGPLVADAVRLLVMLVRSGATATATATLSVVDVGRREALLSPLCPPTVGHQPSALLVTLVLVFNGGDDGSGGGGS